MYKGMGLESSVRHWVIGVRGKRVQVNGNLRVFCYRLRRRTSRRRRMAVASISDNSVNHYYYYQLRIPIIIISDSVAGVNSSIINVSCH